MSSVAAPGLEQEEEEGLGEHASLQEEAHDLPCAVWGERSQRMPHEVKEVRVGLLDEVKEVRVGLQEQAERQAVAVLEARALEQLVWRAEGHLAGSLDWGAGEGSLSSERVAHVLQQEWEKEQQSGHSRLSTPLQAKVVHAVLMQLQHKEPLGPEMAKGLLHWARQWHGMRPSVVLFTTLFSILGRGGDARGLEQAVREVAEAGLALDDRALCSLSSAYHALGLHSKALAVLKSPQAFFPQGQGQGAGLGPDQGPAAARVQTRAPAGMFSAW